MRLSHVLGCRTAKCGISRFWQVAYQAIQIYEYCYCVRTSFCIAECISNPGSKAGISIFYSSQVIDRLGPDCKWNTSYSCSHTYLQIHTQRRNNAKDILPRAQVCTHLINTPQNARNLSTHPNQCFINSTGGLEVFVFDTVTSSIGLTSKSSFSLVSSTEIAGKPGESP